MKAVRMSDEVFRKRAADENGCMISAIGLQPLFAEREELSQHRGESASAADQRMEGGLHHPLRS